LDWDSGRIIEPITIIGENGSYYLYYSGNREGFSGNTKNWSIGLATSNDGIHFRKYPENPVFLPSHVNGDWDSTSVWEPSVIRINELYMMYYTGTNTNGEITGIGLATSSDGVNWKREGLLIAGEREPAIFFKDSRFYLYTGGNGIQLHMSLEGYNFTRPATVLNATQSWEKYPDMESPCIKEITNFDYKYIMAYISHNASSGPKPWKIEFAFSNDLYNWTKVKDNPVIKPDNGENTDFAVTAPDIIVNDSTVTVFFDATNKTCHNQIFKKQISRDELTNLLNEGIDLDYLKIATE
jgi:predicted GH43/DUF377 family glycosyl hydrolase